MIKHDNELIGMPGCLCGVCLPVTDKMGFAEEYNRERLH
jgi:hypothetical protein